MQQFRRRRGIGHSAAVGVPPAGPCATIKGSIGEAGARDTITEAAGTYLERIAVAKKLTLCDAQAGVDARNRTAAESVLTGAPSLSITLSTTSQGGCAS